MIEVFGLRLRRVLAAELFGDKFLYTTGILSSRYQARGP